MSSQALSPLQQFAMSVHPAVYQALKSMGNTMFPEQKNGSRGLLGNALASQFYEPNPINPSAMPIETPTERVPAPNGQTYLSDVFNHPHQQVLAAETSPTPTPISQANPSQDALVSQIRNGFKKYGSPLADQAEYFAQAGNQIGDPLLPAVTALKETSGGKNITRGQNNIFNVDANTGGVDYPDVKTAILGGGGHKGFVGNILNSGYYTDYLKSHNAKDFYLHHSPPNDGNGSIDEQLAKDKEFRSFFQ